MDALVINLVQSGRYLFKFYILVTYGPRKNIDVDVQFCFVFIRLFRFDKWFAAAQACYFID